MTYCIDDLCHGGSPICGAASAYNCRLGKGPSADHLCPGWPDCEMCESDEDEDHGDICLTCAGHGCEESCGLTGGCEHVSAGPYSHKVCVRCSGSGVVR